MQIPAHLIDSVNRLVRTSRRLFRERGREPSAAELAAHLAMPQDRVEKLLALAGLPTRLGSLTRPR